MHHVQGHKHLDDDASLASLSLQESDSVVFSMSQGVVLLKHKKPRPGTSYACLAVVSKLEGCRDALFTVTLNLSNLIAINAALCNNLEHLTFTR